MHFQPLAHCGKKMRIPFLPVLLLCFTLGRCNDSRYLRNATSSSSRVSLQTMVASNTTKHPVVTLKPSGKVKYNMTLSNSGPAVLDSTLHFYVELIEDPSDLYANKHARFIYHWMNMANMTSYETRGDQTSKLSLVFSSRTNKAGEFVMTVAAFFEADPTKMAAFQTNKFVLTNLLNGELTLYQQLQYQRKPNVFRTEQPVLLAVQLYDQFHGELPPTFFFYWYQDQQYLTKTDEPQLTTRVEMPANYTMESCIIALYNADSAPNRALQTSVVHKILSAGDSPCSFYSGDSLRKETLLSNVEGINKRQHQPNKFFLKDGHFSKFVHFKDPLINCTIERLDGDPYDKAIRMGTPAILNITCLGSGPSSVCVNISKSNKTEACRPSEFVESLNHTIKINLNQTGWNYAHFYVFNDISRTYLLESFYGYDADSVNVHLLVFPTVFGFIGLAIVIMGLAYILRLRKKPLVEVADFDFHPSLTTSMRSGRNPSFSRLVNSFKYMFSRDRPHTSQSYKMTTEDLLSESSECKQYYDSL